MGFVGDGFLELDGVDGVGLDAGAGGGGGFAGAGTGGWLFVGGGGSHGARGSTRRGEEGKVVVEVGDSYGR